MITLQLIGVLLMSSTIALLQHFNELPEWYYRELNFKPFSCAPCLSVWITFVMLFFIDVNFLFILSYAISNYTITTFILKNLNK